MPVTLKPPAALLPTTARPSRAATAPVRAQPAPATGYSSASSFEGRRESTRENPYTHEECMAFDDGDDEERPEWARPKRAPFGEGNFAELSTNDMAQLSWGDIKNASARELYSLRGNQIRGFDEAFLREVEKDPKAFDKLKKAQRRGLLRAKIFAGIFEDFKKMLAKHMQIKTE